MNARSPAAVAAGNVETSSRIVDTVCGALAQALPRQFAAASQGTMNNLAMGRRGTRGWDYYETLAGGMGAAQGCNGRSARHSHMTNTLNTPVEVLELNYPLRIEQYAIRRDSGGAGQFRGGDGVVRQYQFLENAAVSLLTERRKHAPWGLDGGRAGECGRNELDGQELPGKIQFNAFAGQVLTIKTPGGGGYGSPSVLSHVYCGVQRVVKWLGARHVSPAMASPCQEGHYNPVRIFQRLTIAQNNSAVLTVSYSAECAADSSQSIPAACTARASTV